MLPTFTTDDRLGRTLMDAVTLLWDEVEAGELFVEGLSTRCLTMLDRLTCKLEEAREQLESGLALHHEGGDEDCVSNYFFRAMGVLLTIRGELETDQEAFGRMH